MSFETIAKDRVRKNTTWGQNVKIDNLTRENIRKYSKCSDREVADRIKSLRKQWDLERMLELNMSTLAITGLALSVFVDKRWAILSGAVLGFFAQHAIQGWCPPLPLFRAMKVRTRAELEEEKYALKALRGDFKNVNSPEEALLAAKKV
jgi:hypothetical protein